MPTIDFHITDLHVGHKAGVMYPDPSLDYKMSKTQRWLWKVWGIMLDEFQGLLDRVKPDYVHISVLGETGDIDWKRRANQYWEKSYAIVSENSIKLLEPLLALADAVHFVKGTKAHVGESQDLDDLVARNFEHTVKPPNEYWAWHAAEYKLEGILFDIAHKGKNRSVRADENLINTLREDIRKDRTKYGRPIPDIVTRGHFHWWGTTSMFQRPIVVQVPSFQLPSDFVTHLDPVQRTPEVGGVAFICDGDNVEIEPFVYTYPRSRVWSPPKK